MRFYLLAICTFFSLLQAENFDLETDHQIYNAVNSKEFSNTIINYPFNGSTYPILVIHNPNREKLWNTQIKDPVLIPLTVLANLPSPLARHIEELTEKSSEYSSDSIVDLRGLINSSKYIALHPVVIFDQMGDPNAENEIKEIFNSQQFVNRVLYFCFNNKYYRARILYNPEGRSFTVSKSFRLSNPDAPLKQYNFNWNYKYGIILDRPAPQELIDYLSSLTNASYWDWYFNFATRNGDFVVFREHDNGVFVNKTTTYTLDTVFNFTDSLKD